MHLGGVMGKASNVAVGEYYFLMSGGTLFFRVADDSSGAYMGISKGSIINDNTWYHIVGTYDGSEMQAGKALYQWRGIHSGFI